MDVRRRKFSRTDAYLIVAEISEETLPVPEGVISFYQLTKWLKEEDIQQIEDALMSSELHVQLYHKTTKMSILHFGAKYGREKFWGILADYRALLDMINVIDIRGSTPLMCAVWHNNLPAIKQLLQNGASAYYRTFISQKTSLHIATSLFSDEPCREILKYYNDKSYIDATDAKGNTALMIAVKSNSASMYALLEYRADYSKVNFERRNILHLAVAYCSYEILKDLIQNIDDINFQNAKDINGDSPLSLAMRLGDSNSIDIILVSQFATALLQRCQPVLKMLVDKCTVTATESILRRLEGPDLFNSVDNYGRTVLLYAIEKGRTDLVDFLLKNNIDITIKNYLTGETVLHVAAYANNLNMVNLLIHNKGIEEIMDEVDFNKNTAYDIVLRKGDHRIWLSFVKTGLIKYDYFNSEYESSLFIAAKEGNYPIVLSLLLSPSFIGMYENTETLEEFNVLEMEMNGEIFPSDVYVLTGDYLEDRRWEMCPFQNHLFEPNVNGQNIFHACALGESLECTSFLYNYCLKFNTNVQDFDKPDNYQNTPIYIALRSGKSQLSKYFMKHGANLAHVNSVGLSIMDTMYRNMPLFKDIFLEVINECAVVDHNKELTLSYYVLCPEGYSQMHVFSKMFNLIKDTEYINILTSPVIEYFVMFKWNILKDKVGSRFFLNSLAVITFTLYLTYSLSSFLHTEPQFIFFLWWLAFIFSVVIFLLNAPTMLTLVKEKNIFMIAIFFYPILNILYLSLDEKIRITREIGAISVLFAWLSVLKQGHFSRLNYQIAMFSNVVSNVFKHMPLCLLIAFAFSASFFTLFHDFLGYNNPIHSLMTCLVQLVEGDFHFPTITDDEPIHKANDMYNTQGDESRILGNTDIRNMLVEGSFLQFLNVLFIITLLNMLIGVSVRSAEQLTVQGKIHGVQTYITEINSWEHFVKTTFYKLLIYSRLSWVFGLDSDLEKRLQVPSLMHPLWEHYLEQFDFHKLKSVAILSDSIKEPSLKFLYRVLDKKPKKNMVRVFKSKGTVSVSWLYP